MLCNVCFNFRSTKNQHHLLKTSKDWVVKKISVKKTYKFREELVRQAIKRRVEHTTVSKVQTPRLPCNIAPVEKPDKDLLIEEHATRFAHNEV